MSGKFSMPDRESGSHSLPNSYPDSPTMYNLKGPGIKSAKEVDKCRHDLKNEAGVTGSVRHTGSLLFPSYIVPLCNSP